MTVMMMIVENVNHLSDVVFFLVVVVVVVFDSVMCVS